MSKGTPRCRLVLQMVALAGSSFILEWMNSGYSFLTPVITKYFMQETISPFWSQSLYSLTLCASIIGLAGLVDRHGGNWVFLAALAWMSIWSLIAGLTTSYVLFCSSRAMQGLAGAAIIPAQTHIIGQLPISKHARPFALAICAALTPLGFLAGVCVASLSPEKVTWRLYFWIASGLSFILLSLHYLSDTQSLQMRTRTTSRKAWLSTALIATGSLCLSYSFALIPYQKASNPRIILPMIIGSFALLLVIWLETRGRGYALIPHSIYKTHENRLFLVMFVCFHASLGIVVFFYPLYVESLISRDRLVSALWWIPSSILGPFFTMGAERALRKVRPCMLMACSAIAWMLCPLFFAALTDSHPSFGMPIVPGTILMSLGIDVTYPVFMIYMTSGQDESRYGIISAVCYMLGEVGIALGPTTANLALTSISSGRTSTTYGRAYWVAFGYSGVGMLLTIYWLVGSGIKRRSASLKYEGSPLAKAQSSSKSRLETTAWTAMSIERPRAVVMLSRGPQHPITYDNQAMDLFQLCRGCATGSTCSLPSTQEDSGADILLANEAGKLKDYR